MGGARLPRLDMTPPQAARTLQRITDSLNAATLAAMPGGGHGTLGSISCQTPPVRGPRHPIHSVPSGYAAYVNQVFVLLGIHREHLDWRQHAAWRPY